MKSSILGFSALAILFASCAGTQLPSEITLSKAELQDKIMGAWAGQTIGCTYGGPTEFRYSGTMINDNIPIEWPDGYIKWYHDNFPGLYDDIYMDLTFVDVFEKEGLDAPIESFEKAFSQAEYMLWHANQQARYNIRQGITGRASGHWENNPHADDIDFQIEADYAGIMSPGMVNAAVHYCDEIGHMMNYGDGWYGGVYVAAMYALAFVSDDVNFVVEEALKVIPEQSRYHRCMSDVIKWHKMYPDNWEITWALCQKNHSFDIGCPDGVYRHFNIDAVINSAYILIGLLYGEGDFTRTIDISTRCGYDSDCNPASAGGILGTMLGYSNIPEKYMKNLRESEEIDFAYTDISLNDVYGMSMRQALQVIEKNGGKSDGETVTIKCQKPEIVGFEEAFAGHWPKSLVHVNKEIRQADEIIFDGKGIVIGYSFFNGHSHDKPGFDPSYAAEVEVILDGTPVEKVILPMDVNSSKPELFYKYNLASGQHSVRLNWLNPLSDKNIYIKSYIVYTEPSK